MIQQIQPTRSLSQTAYLLVLMLSSQEADSNNIPPYIVVMHINYENTGIFQMGLERRLGEQINQLHLRWVDADDGTWGANTQMNRLEAQLSQMVTLAYRGVVAGVIGIIVAVVALATRKESCDVSPQGPDQTLEIAARINPSLLYYRFFRKNVRLCY